MDNKITFNYSMHAFKQDYFNHILLLNELIFLNIFINIKGDKKLNLLYMEIFEMTKSCK